LNAFVRKNESFFKPFLKLPAKWIILYSASHEKASYRSMANIKTRKGVIGILTGGGDVPGLNPAIRAVTLRALREGYQIIGIRHGWAGLVDMVREKDYDNSDNFFLLDEETVDRAGKERLNAGSAPESRLAGN
jgi:Phosphofructokinase